jgi:ABC-type Fe3+ transport system permease subunit
VRLKALIILFILFLGLVFVGVVVSCFFKSGREEVSAYWISLNNARKAMREPLLFTILFTAIGCLALMGVGVVYEVVNAVVFLVKLCIHFSN